MTNIRLHGVLAQEYGQNFYLNVGNPKNALHSIDANREGFIARVIQLQKEGVVYEVIINKTRLTDKEGLVTQSNPATIDLVPAIAGSGPIAAGVAAILGGGGAALLIGKIAAAVVWAALAFALAPTPEVEQQSAEAQASKASQVFSNLSNVASRGAPLPLGYGRLRIGSQVIQSTIKSYPQHQQTDAVLQEQNGNMPNDPTRPQGIPPEALVTSENPTAPREQFSFFLR